jgi:hypothetical protein
MFQRNILSPSPGLKVETICFSSMVVSTDESTQRHIPAEQHDNEHTPLLADLIFLFMEMSVLTNKLLIKNYLS